MARKTLKPVEWPAWRYGPDGQAEIFTSNDEVPVGWQTLPMKEFHKSDEIKVPDAAELRAALKAKGVKPNAFWPNAYMKQLLDSLEE